MFGVWRETLQQHSLRLNSLHFLRVFVVYGGLGQDGVGGLDWVDWRGSGGRDLLRRTRGRKPSSCFLRVSAV